MIPSRTILRFLLYYIDVDFREYSVILIIVIIVIIAIIVVIIVGLIIAIGPSILNLYDLSRDETLFKGVYNLLVILKAI